jgi:membrane carboxypeptidase/penicillin-binding protein
VSLGLTTEQLVGLRHAMISVVERGTARGAGRYTTVTIAGKTGTAQNPHGPAHGWFIGFAPAERPEIVVGAIVEFAREGPYVAPLVARVIARYLGADSTAESEVRMTLPTDTAPHPRRLRGGADQDTSTGENAVPLEDVPPPPPDTSHETPVPGTR